MANQAREVVIIGAGIQGLCCAYSLANQGLTSVTLVEAEDFFGGRSSLRSAAMLTRFTGHESTTALANDSIRLYRNQLFPHLKEVTRDGVEFHACGFAVLAMSPAKVDEIHAEFEEHQRLGVESHILDASQLSESYGDLFRYPPQSVVCLCEEDGYVNISSLVQSLAEFVQSAGVEILRNSKAIGFASNNDGICGVKLEKGNEIQTRNAVNAAGVLAGTVASWIGHQVGIRASKKNLIRLGSVGQRYRGPIVECLDDSWYFRPDGEGLLIGVGSGHDDDLELAERSDPDLDSWAVPACQEYLRKWTHVPSSAIDAISMADGWAGYRPIHARDSPSVGRAPAHLPLFGDPGLIPGYYQSCGWGEYGITLAPIGGQQVALDIVNSGRVESRNSP